MRAYLSNKTLLIILTLVTTASAAWLIVDENLLLQNWRNVLYFLAYWLAVPYLNALLGLLSSKPQRVFNSLAIATFYAVLFLYLALYDSLADRRSGSKYLGLLFGPPFHLMLSMLFLCLVSLFRRIRLWEKSRRSTDL